MMSASEGGSWKSGRSKGGCVNFILQISSKCGQGGRGSKNPKFCVYIINGSPMDFFLSFSDVDRSSGQATSIWQEAAIRGKAREDCGDT